MNFIKKNSLKGIESYDLKNMDFDITDFFDLNKYSGEGNIGHIIEEIKIELKSKNVI